MTSEDIMEALKHDSRNRIYTEKGIDPVLQFHPSAKILIIGQAPGKNAEAAGIPFHDASGKKLMSWMGIHEDTFYSENIAILPMDFYYPGKGKSGDLPPRPFISREYHPAFLAKMPKIRMTLLIGSYAVKYYLHQNRKKNLTETVRHYQEYLPDYFPIVHPSPLNFRWQAKNPWFEADVVPKLQTEVRQILSV